MIKRILLIIGVIALIFICVTFFLNLKEWQNIKNKSKNIIEFQLYNRELYNTLDKVSLIKNFLITYTQTLQQQQQKIFKENINKDLQTIVTLINTLKKHHIKNQINILQEFLLNQKLKENIDILNVNNIIIASTDPKKLNKKFIKSEHQIIKYLPDLKLKIIIKPRNYFNNLNIFKALIQKFPKIIVIQNKSDLKQITNDGIYVLEEYKPLKIFYGFKIKYQYIDEKIDDYHNILSEAIAYYNLKYIGLFIILIGTFYIVLFLTYKKYFAKYDLYLKNIEKENKYDSLTNLYNRKFFEILCIKNPHKKLIILDLDNFKYINDTFGHKKGDEIIIYFSKLLKKYFTEEIIGRWGGDEFLILTDRKFEEIQKIIKIINNKIQKYQLEFDKELSKKLSVSAGICENKDIDCDEKFAKADLALYKAKKLRKGIIVRFKDIDYIKMDKKDLQSF